MDELAKRAIEVLRANARGTWTRPSPRLYPHQWSWDAGFVAMGWAQLDPVRAITELWSLLRGQWATGMVPQIVFDLERRPGRLRARAQRLGHGAPRPARRRPPAASASRRSTPSPSARIREVAAGRDDGSLARGRRRHRRPVPPPRRAGTAGSAPPATPRAPGWSRSSTRGRAASTTRRGGTARCRAVEPDERLDDLPRPDLTYVADPDERPTNPEYRRYRHLVDCLIAVDYDQAKAMADHPFRVADVWFSAILAAADDVLADLAPVAGHPEDADRHRADAEHTRRALDACWDADCRPASTWTASPAGPSPPTPSAGSRR